MILLLVPQELFKPVAMNTKMRVYGKTFKARHARKASSLYTGMQVVLSVMLAQFCCCYRWISSASVNIAHVNCTVMCSSHGTDVRGSKGCVTIILPILQIAGAYHSMNRSGVIPWKVYCVCVCVGACVWVCVGGYAAI